MMSSSRLASLAGIGGSWDRGQLLAMAPRVATAILALGLAAQFGVGVIALGPSKAATTGHPPRLRPQLSQDQSRVDVARIVRAHLFGVMTSDTRDGTPPPETQQPLVLTATLATPDAKHGLAILGNSVQTAQVYAVGADVAAGISLDQVYPDRVILNRGGMLETLQMPRERPVGRKSNDAPVTAARAMSVSAPAAAMSPDDRLNAAGYAKQMLAGFVPMSAFREGHYHGMRVGTVHNTGRNGEAGLKPGDIITAINGTPLTDPQVAASLMRELGATQLNATVERGSETRQVILN
jgi:general secretion pathway protein C